MAKNHTDFSNETAESTSAQDDRFSPSQQVTHTLADIGRLKKRFSTRDLIGILLCHSARAWRHSQPRTRIHLNLTPGGGSRTISMRLR